MTEKYTYPEGWIEAVKKSNRRYMDDPSFFEIFGFRRCRGGPECPLWRNSVCTAFRCILRYPVEDDLVEFMR